MKTLMIFLVLSGISIAGCSDNAQQKKAQANIEALHQQITTDSLTIVALRDDLDSIKNTVPLEAYMNARRIEKIKYYISITDRRPANREFFFGWIKRTLTE